MSKHGKKLEKLLNNTEIIMAIDAAAHEDAAWLDALAEEVNEGINESEIDWDWNELLRSAQKTISIRKSPARSKKP